MPAEIERSSGTSPSGDSSDQQPPPPPPPIKKKRNLPGMPDPEAEVIALSPTTLMATNRFVCDICNKGFQRDQNLQLHRRGHNLPWNLKQRSGPVSRKKVYVCPETSCVHHDPSRALGDLTGIKKHFCRKHGEKKWKCEKCSKMYAVQSDWKAHLKICGTREYRCDCGTLFSRRDSFITHRAFCDVLSEEKLRPQPASMSSRSEEDDRKAKVTVSSGSIPVAAPATKMPLVQSTAPQPERGELANSNSTRVLHYIPSKCAINTSNNNNSSTTTNTSSSNSTSNNNNNPNSATLFASLFSSATASASASPAAAAAPSQAPSFTDLIGSINRPELTSLCLFSPPPPSPHMSATALLQKAAQMGSSTTSSFLRGFGLAPLSSSSSPPPSGIENNHHNYWSNHQQNSSEIESPMLAAGLGLGLPGLMIGSSPSLFGPKPATLDFLGLGIGPALMNLGPGSSTAAWEEPDKKPSSSAFL